jgi:hypothetical protein
MPFGLKNAPLIYQQILDNCLWGFVRLPPLLEADIEPDVLEGVGLLEGADAIPANARDTQVESASELETGQGEPEQPKTCLECDGKALHQAFPEKPVFCPNCQNKPVLSLN